MEKLNEEIKDIDTSYVIITKDEIEKLMSDMKKDLYPEPTEEDIKEIEETIDNTEKLHEEIIEKKQELEKGLIDCVSRGVPKDELIKDLKNTFGIGFRRAETVARTELSYIQNQATLDTYKQSNIKQYQFLGAGGNCDICAQLNGNIYNISDAVVGVNMPPIHPNCRCGILAVI